GCRGGCGADRRVWSAGEAPAGKGKLREASDTHLAGIASQFTGRFTHNELATLSELIARLPGGERTDTADCTVDYRRAPPQAHSWAVPRQGRTRAAVAARRRLRGTR